MDKGCQSVSRGLSICTGLKPSEKRGVRQDLQEPLTGIHYILMGAQCLGGQSMTRTLILVSMLLALSLGQSAQAQSHAAAEGMKEIVAKYVQIQETLSKDSDQGIKD